MSVIIRLQNLPWSANALDIRQYFQGLSIPEGGVHIVGGELGDAFIAFSTDEDARQAFTRNNGKIKEVQISLMLSSRTEMQRVIEAARSQSYAAFMQAAPAAVPPLPAAVPSIVPAAVPDLTKEKDRLEKGDKKRDRRRSRSKSRERRDRSRDRKDKRRSRDRSRSRSRERKPRARRDRSRSRNRSRSRDRDRRSRDRRKRSEERPVPGAQRIPKKPGQELWTNQSKPSDIPSAQTANLLNAGLSAAVLDQAKRSLGSLAGSLPNQLNGFNSNFRGNRNDRDSWPPAQNNFRNDNFDVEKPHFPNRFPRGGFPGRGGNRMETELTNSCLALEPFYGGYGDIRRFFQGMFISNRGIKFINDANGRRTGLVYIQLGNRKSKEEALNLNGEILNGFNVTLTHIDDEEFEEAVDRYVPAHDDNSNDNPYKFKRNPTKPASTPLSESEVKEFTCLTVDDLPTYCKEQDILHMFSQHPLVALILTTKPKGGHIAYVKFSSTEVAQKAFDEKSHHVVGGKPVTVKPCRDEEFEEINKQHDVNLSSPHSETIGTDCLSISRLPQKTTDKDIADFFSDIGVIPTKIHLISNPIGFTGQAYCEFMNAEEASRGLKKNDTVLGNAVISVTPIKREDMINLLNTNMVSSESMGPSGPMLRPPMHGGGPSFRFPHRTPFFNRNFDNGGPPLRGPRFGPRGPRPRFNHPAPLDVDDAPPGCTIYMKNVPYKAGTNEILKFFEGYSHTNVVSRRYNPNNTPSDEAKITFFDAEEASRAVADLNKEMIWDRQIFLRQE